MASLVKSLALDTLIVGDSREELRSLPSDFVHLILSDIPYGIGIEDWDILHDNTNSAFSGSSPAQEKAGAIFRRRGKPINGWSEADRGIPKEYYDWCSSWAAEWLRVLKPGGTAFVFAGRRYAHRCVCALEDAGFSSAWSLTGVATKLRRKSGKVGEWETCAHRLNQFYGLRNPTKLVPPSLTMLLPMGSVLSMRRNTLGMFVGLITSSIAGSPLRRPGCTQPKSRPS